ncbi:MAG TPA: cupin domain-containing protein [bacterium]|jgi:mannose-6-phosphate isomerase-like protein (cupin superfamily)
MTPPTDSQQLGDAFRPADALDRLTADRRSVTVFEHGTLQVKLYAPRGTDPQTPHTRDEVYVVVSGRGQYFDGVARRSFEPGDLLFAPAGCVHRFEQFTDDLAVWVLFYGPEGGGK